MNSVTKLEKYQDPIQKVAASMVADFLALVVTTPECKYATIADKSPCVHSPCRLRCGKRFSCGVPGRSKSAEVANKSLNHRIVIRDGILRGAGQRPFFSCFQSRPFLPLEPSVCAY